MKKMNDLRELLDSLGKTKHLLNEYCYRKGACYTCPLYESLQYNSQGIIRTREICCSQVTTAIGELECVIVKILNKEKKDEN